MNKNFTASGIGRLTKAPLFTKGQKQDGSDDRAWFVVATNPPKRKDGTKPDAHYTPVVCWGVTARNAAQYLVKGQVVAVEGRLNTRAEKREDGSYDHYAEVVADVLVYGPKAKNTAEAGAAPAQAAQAPAAAPAALPGLPPGIDLAQALAALLSAGQAAQPQAAPVAAPSDGGADSPFEG